MTLAVARPRGSLKAAQGRLVDAVGGFERASEIAARSPSTLHRYTDRAHPEASMPVAVVMALEAAAGETPVTEHLALSAGKLVVPLRYQADPAGVGHALARFSAEAGDVFRRGFEALADGRVEPHEARDLLAELADMLAAAAALHSILVPIAATEGQSSPASVTAAAAAPRPASPGRGASLRPIAS